MPASTNDPQAGQQRAHLDATRAPYPGPGAAGQPARAPGARDAHEAHDAHDAHEAHDARLGPQGAPRAAPPHLSRDLAPIQGWGADLDHANRPAYPMARTPPRLDNVHWDAPEQQAVHTRLFHSVERPGITPVFGSTVPPRGLSGWLRTIAFRRSENDVRHWLWLLLADRVDVVEGIGDDLIHGHVPNLWAEMGLRAEWEHNRAGLIRKAAVTAGVLGLGYYLLRQRRRR